MHDCSFSRSYSKMCTDLILYAYICSSRLPTRRLRLLFRLFELLLSILFQNFEHLAAVRMDELAERLKQRKHDVIDESQLHSINNMTTRQQQTAVNVIIILLIIIIGLYYSLVAVRTPQQNQQAVKQDSTGTMERKLASAVPYIQPNRPNTRFTKFSEITQCNGHYAFTPFKVIQGHRFWYQSKAYTTSY